MVYRTYMNLIVHQLILKWTWCYVLRNKLQNGSYWYSNFIMQYQLKTGARGSMMVKYKKYFNVPFINCRSESDFLPNFFNCEISCRRLYIVYTLLYIGPQISCNKLEHNAITLSISLLPIIFTTPYIIRTFPIGLIISSWKRCCPHLKKQNFVL